MKKNYMFLGSALVLLLLAVIYTSCDPKEFAKITVPYSPDDVVVKIDSSQIGSKGEALLATHELYVNIDSILKANNAGKMDDAKMLSVTIRIKEPSTFVFDWLISAHIGLLASGINEQNIASISGINPALNTVDLTINNAGIAELIKKNSLTLKFYGDIVSPFPVPQILLDVKMKMDLKVQLL